MPRAQTAYEPPLLIYRLDPALAGGLQGCTEHLERIAAMAFDHVLVEGAGIEDNAAAPELCAAAEEQGLRALCQVDTRQAHTPEALADRCDQLRALGWRGVRVLAPTVWPQSQWHALLERLHTGDEPMLCIGDAIGAPASEGLALAAAGFDAVIDSGAWWDGEASWYFEQRNALAGFCRPLTFVEDESIGRLRERLSLDGPARLTAAYAAAHTWALTHSHGVIVPMGFEHASALPLRGTALGPADWSRSLARAEADLTSVIADAHRSLAKHPALATPGRIMPLPVGCPDEAHAVQGLHRSGSRSSTSLIVLRRPPRADAADGSLEADLRGAAFAGDAGLERIAECTPGRLADLVGITHDAERDSQISLAPVELRCFELRAAPDKRRAPTKRMLLRRLEQLAPHRIAIEAVSPSLDGGRFPVKRVVGDMLDVEADVFCDGHDVIRSALRIRHAGQTGFTELPMHAIGNDRWRARVPLTRMGRYEYTVAAWRAPIATWLLDARKKRAAGQDISLEAQELARLLAQARTPELDAERERVEETIASLAPEAPDAGARLDEILDGPTADWLEHLDQRDSPTAHDTIYGLTVDRARAMFSAWYELFPRSASDDETRHGTFDDVIARLPGIAAMGFDVLYFPPIHPIGQTNRKGRNNALRADPGEPGSPYAIGSSEGGHDAIHPELGTLEDFHRLVREAGEHGLEIALDFAIQCSPDHPWLQTHPEWFDWRPDGSLRFAENPPKKYEDITNVSFYSEGALPSLWLALRDVVRFWIAQGVKIFRVDNPHTKPYPFWSWLIESIQAEHPDALFLSEAFTRPKVMARLAKDGFSQSYTYFTWRNTKAELAEYLNELTKPPLADAMRPNFFVNTPDINPTYLQTSGRAGFIVRATLAATLSPSWGMLAGYELCEFEPLPGREEYLDSEKYQLRARNWDMPGNIRAEVTRLNEIRRLNPALWQLQNLEFHQTDNPQIIAYSKWTDGLANLVLVAVNLDPLRSQSTDLEIPLWRFGLSDHDSVRVADLISGTDFTWQGKHQRLHLEPDRRPVGIWRLSPLAGTGATRGRKA